MFLVLNHELCLPVYELFFMIRKLIVIDEIYLLTIPLFVEMLFDDPC
jgi:hypothetical protein